MVFGKKKKQPETVNAGTIDGENVFDAAPEMESHSAPPEKQKLSAEEQAKIQEIKEQLAWFDEKYGQINFGSDLYGLKNLLFGILIEMKKLNDSQNEEE